MACLFDNRLDLPDVHSYGSSLWTINYDYHANDDDFTLFLFNWAIRTDWLKGENFYRLKQLSILYFFIHPIFIELLSFPSVSEMFDPLYFGWVTFFLTLFGTHCLSLLIMNLSNKFSQLKASS